ncbi:capsule biosynthesis protein [Rhizobium deserti]|uniref:Capsule biosynthesis protein n=1 Tax=Rhizobium deserti TaxID=2547961 RepID=A0A4V3APU7_9HYPH|nr:capsule biosynthesis protein [Rhizobium deserti]TDK39140.1 capsule biosynthesis protein [Rhizobium deserti]
MSNNEHLPPPEDRSAAVLDYNRNVANRLSVTARKLRLATSNRSSLFKAVGLRPRVIDRIFAAGVALLTVLLLIVPIAAAVTYYGFIATDQYQSEARFTVRSSTPALGKDQIAKVTGLPTAKIAQDTQIAINYILSGEMTTALSKDANIRKIYSDANIDPLARLKPDATAEELLDYWRDMVSTGVSASSGIVTVKVRAFSPEDARRILEHVVDASERVVNDINNRIWKDVIETAQANLRNGAAQLQTAREHLQAARNKTGVLDVGGASVIITSLLANAQTQLLDLQQKYNSQLVSVSRKAPQMLVLGREIASKQAQIDDLKLQLAGQKGNRGSLADTSLDLSQLELEQTLAERQFAASVKTVEQVQFVSKQQLVYLDPFLSPTLPEEAEYPHRGLWIGCVVVISLLAWSASLGLLSIVRTRLN